MLIEHKNQLAMLYIARKWDIIGKRELFILQRKFKRSDKEVETEHIIRIGLYLFTHFLLYVYMVNYV